MPGLWPSGASAGLEGGGRLIQSTKAPWSWKEQRTPQDLSSKLTDPSILAVRQLQAEKLQNRVYMWDLQQRREG